MRKSPVVSITRPAAALLLASSLLCGCQVVFISNYDATTDRGVTDLQSGIERHLSELEALAAEPPGLESLIEQCDSAQFAGTYQDLHSKLRALIVRNEARDKNQLTVDQLKLLQSSIDALRRQQQERFSPTDPEREVARPGDRCMSGGQVEANRQILEQHIRAILKLELAKRDFRREE